MTISQTLASFLALATTGYFFHPKANFLDSLKWSFTVMLVLVAFLGLHWNWS